MTRVIGEYEITIALEQTIGLPAGSEIIRIDTYATEPDTPILWAIHPQITPETEIKPVKIWMMGGSTQMDEDNIVLKYLDSFAIRGKTYIIHVFREIQWIGEDGELQIGVE
jgi:hypothetical protein